MKPLRFSVKLRNIISMPFLTDKCSLEDRILEVVMGVADRQGFEPWEV
ncbi:hypothetical protein WCX72_12260 [Sulfurimonas sp. HSL1-6]